MDVHQQTIQEFATGQGTATATAAPIVASNMSAKAFKGVRVRADKANSATLYLGPAAVSAATGYPLAAGESVEILVDDPSKVYVIGAGMSFAWLSA